MTDFASLGIRIDSSQAKKAFEDLQKLESAGEGAEKAVEGVAKAADKAADGLKGASDATKDAGKSIEDYTRKVENLGKSQVAAAAAAKQIELSTKSAAAAQSNFGRGALDAAQVKNASNAIDEQVKKLQQLAATNGMTAREAKLYELALNGASKAQLQAADSAIRMNEGYQKGIAIGERLRSGFIATAQLVATAAAAAGVAAIALGKDAIAALASLKDLSDATGASIGNISALDRVARETGGSFETVSSSLLKFNQVLSNATGKDDASRVFKALGLSVKELKELDPAEALRVTAVALTKFADDGDKARAVQELFGKSVKEVGPFLKDLAETTGLQAKRSEEAVEQADKFAKSLALLKANSDDAARSIVSNFLPALNAILSTYNNGGLAAAIDEFGERAFGWTSNAQSKRIKSLTQDIANLREESAAIGLDIFGQKGAIAREIDNKVSELRSLEKAFMSRSYGDTSNPGRQADGTPEPPKPSLKVDPKPGKKDNSASQEAKAQLAFDLEDIRKAQDALSNTIANGEKLLEARRAANLVSEADYWEQKRQFVIENSQVQQQGLEKELARLQQEKLSGKDAIDNSRKILDVEAKLKKAREDGANNLVVLGVKQADALDKQKIKYEEASKAAQDYVDTIARANSRELDGMGRGSQQREIDDRRSQREDQFRQRRDQLRDQLRRGDFGRGSEGQEEFDKRLSIEEEAYKKVLKLDEEYWAGRKKNQESGLLGASEALQNFIDQAGNAYERGNRIVTDGLNGFSDSLTASLLGEDGKWEDLGRSVARQLVKGLVDTNLIKPAAELLQKLIGGGGTIGGALGLAGAEAGGGGASVAQAAMATSAASATTALAGLTTAATSAAAALGGASIGNSIGSATGGGSSGIGGWFSTIARWLGFSEGGYTGDGGKYQPAGIVHAGEGVLSQEDIAALGGESGFNSLRRLLRNGYADGGMVTPLPPSVSSSSAGVGRRQSFVFSPVTEIKVDSRADQAAVRLEVQRIVQNNNEQYTRELQRLGVIPQGNR